MNWRTIAITAALLALQAVILSLLQAASSHATTVYRCGTGQYQATPCSAAEPQRGAMVFKDERTPEQIQQAQQGQFVAASQGKRETKRRGKRQGKRSEPSLASSSMALPQTHEAGISQGRVKQSRRDKGAGHAVALTRHRHGMAPFDDGRLLSDASTSKRPKAVTRPKRPDAFVARVPDDQAP